MTAEDGAAGTRVSLRALLNGRPHCTGTSTSVPGTTDQTAHLIGSPSAPVTLKPMGNRLPVGPGSRGGSFHANPAAYHRKWRRMNPEYAERERLRSAMRRRAASERAAMRRLSFTEAVLVVVAERVIRVGVLQVGNRLGMSHRTIGRWLKGERAISGEGVDAVVATYGLRAVIARMEMCPRERAEELIAKAATCPKHNGNQYRPVTDEDLEWTSEMLDQGKKLGEIMALTGWTRAGAIIRIRRTRLARGERFTRTVPEAEVERVGRLTEQGYGVMAIARITGWTKTMVQRRVRLWRQIGEAPGSGAHTEAASRAATAGASGAGQGTV